MSILVLLFILLYLSDLLNGSMKEIGFGNTHGFRHPLGRPETYPPIDKGRRGTAVHATSFALYCLGDTTPPKAELSSLGEWVNLLWTINIPLKGVCHSPVTLQKT